MGYWLDKGAFAPEKAHPEDAGFDLRTPKKLVVPARGSAKVDTGVHFEVPLGCGGLLVSKSGLNVKHGILSDGLIDPHYQGSIVVKLYNNSYADYVFEAGDKVTQLVIVKLEPVTLEPVDGPGEETARGSRGFGSSGK